MNSSQWPQADVTDAGSDTAVGGKGGWMTFLREGRRDVARGNAGSV